MRALNLNKSRMQSRIVAAMLEWRNFTYSKSNVVIGLAFNLVNRICAFDFNKPTASRKKNIFEYFSIQMKYLNAEMAYRTRSERGENL